MIARFTMLATALLIAGQADTLRFRNGSTVTGSFLGGSADEVRFMVDDQVQRYPRGDVAAVIFSSDETGSAAPIAPIAPPPPVAIQPDVIGAPFLRGASGLIPLEREYAMPARGNMGYGMGTSVYRIEGGRSPVRVRQGDKLVFVVRLGAGGDPRQFELYQLESRMNYRQTRPGGFGGRPPAWPVTIAKISDSVYEIRPARPLYPGEYSVTPVNTSDAFCFGVDY